MKTRLIQRLGQLHRFLSHSGWAVSVAIKIEHQCQAIIRAHLNDGIEFERNGEYLLVSAIAPTAHVFVDVGANVGAWSQRFAQLMQEPGFGLLVEPSPEALARLSTLVPALKCGAVVVDAAAADRVGEATFFVEPWAGETSSLVPGCSSQGARAVKVRMTTIDREVASRGIEFIDFLKIDAEGFDLKVLLGARDILSAGRVGIVQFEYNSSWAQSGSTLAEAIRTLTGYGYEVFLLKADGLYKVTYQLYGEYFGYSNYVAVSPHQSARIESLRRGQI